MLCQEIFPQKRTLFSRHFLVVVFLVRVDLFRSRRSSLTARYGLLDGHCFPIHRRSIPTTNHRYLFKETLKKRSAINYLVDFSSPVLRVSIKCAGPLHCDSLNTSGRKVFPGFPCELTVENESTRSAELLLLLPSLNFYKIECIKLSVHTVQHWKISHNQREKLFEVRN